MGPPAAVPRGKVMKIKLEVDTEPPPGFATEARFFCGRSLSRSGRSACRPICREDHAVFCRGLENPGQGP